MNNCLVNSPAPRCRRVLRRKGMKFINTLLIVTSILLPGGMYAQSLQKEFPKSFSVTIANPLDVARMKCMVALPAAGIGKVCSDFNPDAFVVLSGGVEIPSQFNTGDTGLSGIVTVLDKIDANQSTTLIVRYSPKGASDRHYKKSTQAELSHKTGGRFVDREYAGGTFHNVSYLHVPSEHKDHSWFIRYEGPGWESDLVGYRFYLDQRDAVDVFGKKTHEMVLQDIGQDGFDSYHTMQPWGMDVMKVGKSLGLGTPGMFVDGNAIRIDKTDSVDCRITENGVVYSSILTRYYGWHVAGKKLDVQTRLAIHAGTRMTHALISASGNPETLCTGIVKDKNAKLFSEQGDVSHWGYLATYGQQSLNNDNLGLAVFFHPKMFNGFTEDAFSHVVNLRTDHGKLDYYFLAAWELEPKGIKNEKEFLEYLEQMSNELANPLNVAAKKK